jgi:hypothetical protein
MKRTARNIFSRYAGPKDIAVLGAKEINIVTFQVNSPTPFQVNSPTFAGGEFTQGMASCL